MHKKDRLKDSLKFASVCVSGVGALVYIADSITDTELMPNITLPQFLVLLVLCVYFLAILYLIFPAVLSLIQGMRPVNRFRHLHSEIKREWQNTKNDNEFYWLDTERPLGEIYRDRERLSLKLKEFRISTPDPKDPRNWVTFIQKLSPLCEEGRLHEARLRYGDTSQFC